MPGRALPSCGGALRPHPSFPSLSLPQHQLHLLLLPQDLFSLLSVEANIALAVITVLLLLSVLRQQNIVKFTGHIRNKTNVWQIADATHTWPCTHTHTHAHAHTQTHTHTHTHAYTHTHTHAYTHTHTHTQLMLIRITSHTTFKTRNNLQNILRFISLIYLNRETIHSLQQGHCSLQNIQTGYWA